MSQNKILLYSKRQDGIEENFDKSLLKDFQVLSTHDMLDVIHILKKDHVAMVLVIGDFTETEHEAFKSMVDLLKPGVNVMFVKPESGSGDCVSLNKEDFCRYLKGTIKNKTSLSGQLSLFKDFFMSFSDRMLQIFGATNRYFFNRDHLVARLSKKTALKLGLSEERAENIQIAALLRDMGMLSIQQQLLEEKRAFSHKELTSIKKHPHNTVQILKQIKFPWNVDSIILQHHENYDGSGYPSGLHGRDICIGARIVHLADSYVAMTTERPHRPAHSHEEARREIVKHIGSDYDPEIAEKFLTVLDKEMRKGTDKQLLLVFEESPNISRAIKLGVDMGDFDVVQAASALEVLDNVERELPGLMLVDVQMLKGEVLKNFFSTMYEIPLFGNCPIIFVMTDPAFPKHFKGDHIRYMSMPLDMGELMLRTRELLGNGREKQDKEDKAEPKGLIGNIEDFHLTEIVQILQMGLKTARVDIRYNNKQGVIYMRNGNIVHVSNNMKQGEDAFFEMMSWPSGRFRIQHNIETDETNITSETTYLLLESARVADEMKRQPQPEPEETQEAQQTSHLRIVKS
ncbi:MAG: DUF4388 domain-containing protein [Deltaproteobacteria bacterium]|nr:DUF4388 domain-containing protein [Deltaproteobacteria bacterium]